MFRPSGRRSWSIHWRVRAVPTSHSANPDTGPERARQQRQTTEQKKRFSLLILPQISRMDRRTELKGRSIAVSHLFPLQKLLIKLSRLRIGICGIWIHRAAGNDSILESRRRLTGVRARVQPLLGRIETLPALDPGGKIHFTPLGVERRLLECRDLREKCFHE